MTDKKISVALEPISFFLDDVRIGVNKEDFRLLMRSGNQARTYVASPMHAKRLMLLLEREIGKYEEKFGELKTTLPAGKGPTTEERKIGF